MRVEKLAELTEKGKVEITGKFLNQRGETIVQYRDHRWWARAIHPPGLPGEVRIPPPREPISTRIKRHIPVVGRFL